MEIGALNKAIGIAESAVNLIKSHVKGYTRTSASGAAVQVKEHDDSRHPNIIGQAHNRDNTMPAATHEFTHDGKRYSSTGKTGTSMHDGRPVREFEEVGEDTGHRVWYDNRNNVHADSKEEADKHHKRGKYADFAAEDASALANSLSTKAHKSGKAEDHKAAEMAHLDAAHENKKNGTSDDVAFHMDAASEHERKGKADSGPDQADRNEHKWDSLPDEENPRGMFQTASSKALGHIAAGKKDGQLYAKHELANRGLDSDAKWVGFHAADKHHGITPAQDKALAKEADTDSKDSIIGDMQTMHSALLSAAAKGHLDLQKRAKHELAARGHDNDGNWIGFDKANKLHGVK